jgi:hypothetical protein
MGNHLKGVKTMSIVAITERPAAAKDELKDFRPLLAEGTRTRDEIRDRAAYVYVTGQFPSHLRRNYTGILRAMSQRFRKPVSLDGRSGTLALNGDVAVDLKLEDHPMVREVRRRVSEGFVIQPSRGMSTRKPFGKVFMYKTNRRKVERVTVQIDGSVLEGWGMDS